MKPEPVTAENIRSLVFYDPETGHMHRLSDGLEPRDSGNGYKRISINRIQFYVHRLAFLYMTGEWPRHHVDHRDLNPSNNRWTNLREATPQQNHINRRINKNNSTGFKGVKLDRRALVNPWRAQICINGRSIDLGGFATPEAAHAKYLEEATRRFGEYARGNK